jgi:hypothetical protein
MPGTLYPILCNLLSVGILDDIAFRLREPRPAISRGIEGSAASLIDCLAHRAGDFNWLMQVYNRISETPRVVNISALARIATSAGGVSVSPISALRSRRLFLWTVFGSNLPLVLDGLAASAGLRRVSTSMLMDLVATLFMTMLDHKVRDNGLNPAQLGELFANECMLASSCCSDFGVRPRAWEAVHAAPEQKAVSSNLTGRTNSLTGFS